MARAPWSWRLPYRRAGFFNSGAMVRVGWMSWRRRISRIGGLATAAHRATLRVVPMRASELAPRWRQVTTSTVRHHEDRLGQGRSRLLDVPWASPPALGAPGVLASGEPWRPLRGREFPFIRTAALPGLALWLGRLLSGRARVRGSASSRASLPGRVSVSLTSSKSRLAAVRRRRRGGPVQLRCYGRHRGPGSAPCAYGPDPLLRA